MTDLLISNINRLESWLKELKGNPVYLPVRFGGFLVLLFFMMISNIIALIRWPFAAFFRLVSKPGPAETGDSSKNGPVEADKELFQKLLAQEDLMLADFWAEWCGPCVMMNDSIKRLAAEHTHCRIAKINTTINGRLAKKYGVKGLPTLILFQDGKEVKRYAGALSYPELVDFIERSV